MSSLIQTTSLVAISQSLVLSVFLVTTGGKGKGNRLLAALLLAFALLTTGFLIMSSMLYVHWYALATLTNQVAFLIGPLLYLHIRSWFDPELRISWAAWLLHCLPSVAALMAVAAGLLLSADPLGAVAYITVAMSAAVLVQNLAYLVASARLLRANGIAAVPGRGGEASPRASWLRFIMLGYVVIWVARLQFFLVGNVLANPRWCPYTMSLYFLSAFLFSNTAVYLALRRPELFRARVKYAGSALDAQNLPELTQQLVRLMESEKPHRDPALSLTVLASKVGVTRRQLSQLLNSVIGMSFPDYVNLHRVEDAKLLLADDSTSTATVLEIAYDVGFSSKSTFNAAFKKHTGTTPREYRESVSDQ